MPWQTLLKIASHPTCIAELISFSPVAEGHRDASGTITNSDLELAGVLLHLSALAQSFDIIKCTVLSKGDNLSTKFWE
ncbi:hypothetical protein ACHAW6_014587 [Cyclotella cf. meneghiniana]